MHYLSQQAATFKLRARAAAREILFCDALAVVVLSVLAKRPFGDTGHTVALFLVGFFLGPVLWILYRFVRFVIGG